MRTSSRPLPVEATGAARSVSLYLSPPARCAKMRQDAHNPSASLTRELRSLEPSGPYELTSKGS
jgi:hypothetical protein